MLQRSIRPGVCARLPYRVPTWQPPKSERAVPGSNWLLLHPWRAASQATLVHLGVLTDTLAPKFMLTLTIRVVALARCQE